MTCTALVSVAQLGDCLGLARLIESAAEILVQWPWSDNMESLAAICSLDHVHDRALLRELLHHPNRGAVIQLQVLELLNCIVMPEEDVVFVLNLEKMQAA